MGDLRKALHRHGHTGGHAHRAIAVIGAATGALIEKIAYHVRIVVFAGVHILELYKATPGAAVTEALPFIKG